MRPPRPQTDLGNAERLVDVYGDRIRYVYAWNTWLVWDGSRWRRDNSGAIERCAKYAVRSIYNEAANTTQATVRGGTGEWALRSESRERIRAMIDLARSEKGIPIQPELLDADPWLLNAKNGTVDLRTGELREFSQADLITRRTEAPFYTEAKCPRFDQFLEEILPDADVRGYVQKAAGYSITGNTVEEALFLPYGTGRNGKSALLRALEYALGDYAQFARAETFMTKMGDHIPNDVAGLAGARFVPSCEADEGKNLAVGLVKQLTGGDTVEARFLHRDFFRFRFVGKVWLAVNHLPVIRDTTESIWERVKVIPFPVTFYRTAEEGAERDTLLKQQLEEEAAGVLRWAIQGCLRWQAEGLGEPPMVLKATGRYRTVSDPLGRFLKSHVEPAEGAELIAGTLYTQYESWCHEHGEAVIGKSIFGRQLLKRGYKPGRDSTRRWWQNVRLKEPKPARGRERTMR